VGKLLPQHIKLEIAVTATEPKKKLTNHRVKAAVMMFHALRQNNK